jgi:hypothetical protein
MANRLNLYPYFRNTICSHPLRYFTRALLHFGGSTRASH